MEYLQQANWYKEMEDLLFSGEPAERKDYLEYFQQKTPLDDIFTSNPFPSDSLEVNLKVSGKDLGKKTTNKSEYFEFLGGGTTGKEDGKGSNSSGKKRKMAPAPAPAPVASAAEPEQDEETHTAKKEHHNYIEKKRRKKINSELEQLKELNPYCKTSGANKLSILHFTCEYIQHLQDSLKKLLDNNKTLKDKNDKVQNEIRDFQKFILQKEDTVIRSLIAPPIVGPASTSASVSASAVTSVPSNVLLPSNQVPSVPRGRINDNGDNSTDNNIVANIDCQPQQQQQQQNLLQNLLLQQHQLQKQHQCLPFNPNSSSSYCPVVDGYLGSLSDPTAHFVQQQRGEIPSRQLQHSSQQQQPPQYQQGVPFSPFPPQNLHHHHHQQQQQSQPPPQQQPTLQQSIQQIQPQPRPQPQPPQIQSFNPQQPKRTTYTFTPIPLL